MQTNGVLTVFNDCGSYHSILVAAALKNRVVTVHVNIVMKRVLDDCGIDVDSLSIEGD